jgi:hypothetical protein
MAKVGLNLQELTVTEKVEFARSIVTAMTGNPKFPSPAPSLEALTQAANELEAKSHAVQVKRQAAQAGTSEMYDAEAALDLMLVQLANYVEMPASTGFRPSRPWPLRAVTGKGSANWTGSRYAEARIT